MGTMIYLYRKLEGSCQCGTVTFSLLSNTPYPFSLCLCSICRKLAGASGGSINLGGIFSSLKIETGEASIKKYSALRDRGLPSEKRCNAQRSFCAECGSMLWLWDSDWPELVHPFASAIDTELPPLKNKDGKELDMVVLMTDSRPGWVRLPEGGKETFKQYPELSLEDWHKKHGVWVE
jgi:hypothetical protein